MMAYMKHRPSNGMVSCGVTINVGGKKNVTSLSPTQIKDIHS